MMMSQSYQLIKDLYECDTVSGECRICPKLRRVHIQPTSFQRMNIEDRNTSDSVACLFIYVELINTF